MIILDDFMPQKGGNMRQFRAGSVVALFAGGHPQIQFDGETSPSGKKYSRLASYATPARNDRVLLMSISGTYIILGKIVTPS
jgi:hypothetical protein